MSKHLIIISISFLVSKFCFAQEDCNVSHMPYATAYYNDLQCGYLFFHDERRNTFEYRIYNHAIDSTTHMYCGTFTTVKDTLFLQYQKGNAPAGMKPFIIREFSNSFFIQYFNDGTRKFLWQKQPRFR